jgi:hypothetical protein
VVTDSRAHTNMSIRDDPSHNARNWILPMLRLLSKQHDIHLMKQMIHESLKRALRVK